MKRPREAKNTIEWKVQQPWIIYANQLEAERDEAEHQRDALATKLEIIEHQRDQLTEDKRELMKTLERIEGNFYDARQVARNALDRIKALEVE